MSHRWTSALYDHLYHCFIVKDVQQHGLDHQSFNDFFRVQDSVGDGYVSHIGLRPLMIIMINASLSSELYTKKNVRLWPRDRYLTTDRYPGYLPSSTWRLMCLLQFPATH